MLIVLSSGASCTFGGGFSSSDSSSEAFDCVVSLDVLSNSKNLFGEFTGTLVFCVVSCVVFKEALSEAYNVFVVFCLTSFCCRCRIFEISLLLIN